MAQDDAEDAAGDSAFIPDPEELRRVAEEVAAQYPPPRLGTELVLLEVDPRRAHAYWNIDVADREAAGLQAGVGDHPLVLRMRDVTEPTGTAPSFDVEVQGLQNHWYIDLWEPGRAYVAEIGLRLPDGSLVSIAHSNRVETPRAGQSDAAEVVTLDVGEPYFGPVMAELAAATQADAAATRADAPPMTILPSPAPPAESVLQDRYPDPLSAPPVAPVAGSAAPAATVPPAPVRTVPPPTVGPWPSAEELTRHLPDVQERFAELLHAPVPPAAPDQGAVPSPAPAVASMPAPVPPPTPAASGGPATSPPAALDQYVNLSSFVNGRTDVDLEVNVELHIYGRAKPGAQLTFYGQRVALRPDGTFSIRKPLPQGAVVLPLVLRPESPDDPGPKV